MEKKVKKDYKARKRKIKQAKKTAQSSNGSGPKHED